MSCHLSRFPAPNLDLVQRGVGGGWRGPDVPAYLPPRQYRVFSNRATEKVPEETLPEFYANGNHIARSMPLVVPLLLRADNLRYGKRVL